MVGSNSAAALARLREEIAPQPGPRDGSARMAEVTAFGANPGQLKMLLYAPPGLARGRPLVVVLHGCTQTAERYARGAGWLALADRFRFAVVCPQQQKANNPNLCFNWFEAGDTRRGAGEAASIRNMVDTAARTLGTNQTQIFVTGLSAGGAMASALLAAYPDVFAGGGIVAGLPYGVAEGVSQAFAVMFQDSGTSANDLGARVRLASAHEGPWPRISVWHGTADTTVRPSNADAVIAQWADVHGLDAQPSRTDRFGGRTHDIWTRGGETVLERNIIAGLGHGTPLAATGPKGVGKPGPFLLEAGVSSSLELLTFWKVIPATQAEARRAEPQVSAETSAPAVMITRVRERPVAPEGKGPDEADESSGIGAIINKALRKAGLM